MVILTPTTHIYIIYAELRVRTAIRVTPFALWLSQEQEGLSMGALGE